MPKDQFEDDGRTVVSMDFDEVGSRYRGRTVRPKIDYKQRHKEVAELKMTSKERRALTLAVYSQLIPFVLIMFGSMALFMLLLMFLWR
ncbi:MAG: hypothetical protein CVV63_00435 [Tenericutes bacterium HGW-Tenericutes-8]|nr:MAG: hypothetical protein CVV63_00435 [Tenericutes bacterium HGW-Tenericutes-8]